jgi:hypothetical protein
VRGNLKLDTGTLTYKDLQAMRALASAMLTASLTTGAMDLAGLKDLSQATNAREYIERVAQESVIKGGVQAGVGTTLYGGDLGQNLLNGLRDSAVDTLGADLATQIGEAARNNKLDDVSRMIAHAALGGAMAAADGKDAASGALGAVVGEITADALGRELKEKLNNGSMTAKDVESWIGRGVDISKLAAGIAAAAAGLDVNTAAQTGGNAAQNNSLKSLLTAIYVVIIGKGNLIDGLASIGRGDDPLSKALNGAIVGGVKLAADAYPQETQFVLELLGKAGGLVDATVTYFDKKSGGYISTTWSSIPKDDRDAILGLVTVVTLDTNAIKKVAGLKQTAVGVKQAEYAASAARKAETVAALPKEIVALSEANIRNSGITVLGSYPGYIEKATANNASYFSIGKAWDKLTDAQREAANFHFLDIISSRGDKVYLSTNVKNVIENTALWKEIQYLTTQKGYKIGKGGMVLHK